MAQSDRSSSRLPMIAGAGALVLVVVLGGLFLRLGMGVVPPEQTQVHKELPAAMFATSGSAAAALPAMPPVPTAPAAGTAQPAPVPAPVAAAPVAPAAPALTPSGRPSMLRHPWRECREGL